MARDPSVCRRSVLSRPLIDLAPLHFVAEWPTHFPRGCLVCHINGPVVPSGSPGSKQASKRARCRGNKRRAIRLSARLPFFPLLSFAALLEGVIENAAKSLSRGLNRAVAACQQSEVNNFFFFFPPTCITSRDWAAGEQKRPSGTRRKEPLPSSYRPAQPAVTRRLIIFLKTRPRRAGHVSAAARRPARD